MYVNSSTKSWYPIWLANYKRQAVSCCITCVHSLANTNETRKIFRFLLLVHVLPHTRCVIEILYTPFSFYHLSLLYLCVPKTNKTYSTAHLCLVFGCTFTVSHSHSVFAISPSPNSNSPSRQPLFPSITLYSNKISGIQTLSFRGGFLLCANKTKRMLYIERYTLVFVEIQKGTNILMYCHHLYVQIILCLRLLHLLYLYVR